MQQVRATMFSIHSSYRPSNIDDGDLCLRQTRTAPGTGRRRRHRRGWSNSSGGAGSRDSSAASVKLPIDPPSSIHTRPLHTIRASLVALGSWCAISDCAGRAAGPKWDGEVFPGPWPRKQAGGARLAMQHVRRHQYKRDRMASTGRANSTCAGVKELT
jgi:hypothetical protein